MLRVISAPDIVSAIELLKLSPNYRPPFYPSHVIIAVSVGSFQYEAKKQAPEGLNLDAAHNRLVELEQVVRKNPKFNV